MKRILSLIFALSIILCIFSCGKKSEYEKIIAQIEKNNYDQVQYYDSDMINSIVENAATVGMVFEGKINNVAHFAKSAYVNEWVYAYEFELENDAKLFYENHAKNWDYAKIKDTVVVFGASRFIKDLDM